MSRDRVDGSTDKGSPDRPAQGVLVVGTGPTGLMLAAELAGAGVSCTVVDGPPEPSPDSPAVGLDACTLELLDSRDVADRLLAVGMATPSIPARGGRPALPLDDLDSRFPYFLLIPQHETARVLAEWAIECGARILRGVVFESLLAGPDAVTVRLRGRDGELTRRFDYVVGCGGAGPAVTTSATGRILLAGAVGPAGPDSGSDLRFGIADAVNLGWKLAAVVTGRAASGLLDSYPAERSRSTATARRRTDLWSRLTAGTSLPARTVRRTAVAAITVPAVRRRVLRELAGLDDLYPTMRHPGADPAVGRRYPDVVVTSVATGAPRPGTRGGPARLAEALRHGLPVVLDDGSDGDGDDHGLLAGVRRTWPGAVTTCRALSPLPTPARSSVLLRPDGFTAWVGRDQAELNAELRSWWGVPRPSAAPGPRPEPISAAGCRTPIT